MSFGVNPFLNINLGQPAWSGGQPGAGLAATDPFSLPASGFLSAVSQAPQGIDSFVPSSGLGISGLSGFSQPADQFAPQAAMNIWGGAPTMTQVPQDMASGSPVNAFGLNFNIFASAPIADIYNGSGSPTMNLPPMGSYAPGNTLGLNLSALATGDFSDANLLSMGVSSSFLMLRDQISCMMGSVLNGIGPLVQQVLSNPANMNVSPQNPGEQENDPSCEPIGSGTEAAVEWAEKEADRHINEKTNLGYIKKNYSQGENRPWCADFVSTAFKKNGGMPWGSRQFPAVSQIRSWGQQHGKYIRKGQGTPRRGDIIIFESAGASHTGIVTDVKNGKVYTVEGNSSDAVRRRSYSLNYKTISGYVRV
jgi:hypothetical protein